MCAEQTIISPRGAISNNFYMAIKPNVLCFNEYISDHLKNENDKRGKTPRTAEFVIFGAPPKKIGNLRGRGVGRSFARTRSYVTFAV